VITHTKIIKRYQDEEQHERIFERSFKENPQTYTRIVNAH
jgi:hypothetical protein